MPDTIFALSSGPPPAAIAVVRISGPHAAQAMCALAGTLPAPRAASFRVLRDRDGDILDQALVLWLPGPRTATGEDIAELHLHGGRAVVAAVEAALGNLPKLRRATAGEFTRRAFANGRIDLSEAEGLADLLEADTELQRKSALALAEGALSHQVGGWRETLLHLSAQIESALDFSDEDDVGGIPECLSADLARFAASLEEWLSRPRAETLREGFKVAIAGPPNAGKSTLFNALVESEAAITAPVAGTTRDVLKAPVAIAGIPFLFIDTAGLHEGTGDVVEAIGIERARAILPEADVVLWLGDEGEGPKGAWEIESQSDLADRSVKIAPRHRLSARTGDGLDALRSDLVASARAALPKPGEVALNARQHELIRQAWHAAASASEHNDLLIVGEHLRVARVSFDSLLGRTTTEDMLDALFGRFCIGK